MNVLNRIWVIVDILLLLFLCTMLFITPVPILEAVGDGLLNLAAALDGAPEALVLGLGILFAVLLVVVCVLMLYLQVRRPRPKTVRVQKIDGSEGEVEVSMRTVGEHIVYAVDQLPGVLRARTQVTVHKGGVVVEVDVETAGGPEVPARAAEVVAVVRQVVEERVGVRLARPPRVKLQARPLAAAPRAAGIDRRAVPERRPPVMVESPLVVEADSEAPVEPNGSD